MRDFLGRGFRFPLRPVVRPNASIESIPRTGLAWSEGPTQVAQSIWLILATSPGERLMRPTFGCGIHELVFEPNAPALHDEVRVRVGRALAQFEPRIDLEQVAVESPDGLPNQLLIEVSYRLRSNNAIYNLVYPFYLREGVG